MRTERKNIVVTGGSSGIGLELTKRLVGHDNTVYNFDVQPPLQKIEGVQFHHVDVTRSQEVARSISNVWGKIDVLCSNAGVLRRGGVLDTTEEEFDAMFGVNVKGPWLLMHETMLQKKLAPNAVMLQTASAVALQPHDSLAVYSLTKQTVHNLIELLRRACPELTIKVAYPGAVRTPMTQGSMSNAEFDHLVTERWGRWDPPETLAGMMVQLLESDTHRELVYNIATKQYDFR